MRSIITSYPDFQSLPKGLKKMLLISESLFFGEAKAAPALRRDANVMTRPMTSWRRPANRRCEALPPFWGN